LSTVWSDLLNWSSALGLLEDARQLVLLVGKSFAHALSRLPHFFAGAADGNECRADFPLQAGKDFERIAGHDAVDFRAVG
jgi:hypothetical protein